MPVPFHGRDLLVMRFPAGNFVRWRGFPHGHTAIVQCCGHQAGGAPAQGVHRTAPGFPGSQVFQRVCGPQRDSPVVSGHRHFLFVGTHGHGSQGALRHDDLAGAGIQQGVRVVPLPAPTVLRSGGRSLVFEHFAHGSFTTSHDVFGGARHAVHVETVLVSLDVPACGGDLGIAGLRAARVSFFQYQPDCQKYGNDCRLPQPSADMREFPKQRRLSVRCWQHPRCGGQVIRRRSRTRT